MLYTFFVVLDGCGFCGFGLLDNCGYAVHLAVAGGFYDGVFLCCPFFPRAALHEILDLIESVSEGFLTYSCCLGIFDGCELRCSRVFGIRVSGRLVLLSRSLCVSGCLQFLTVLTTWARGYKTYFMLNSAEHEILNALKFENIKKLSIFQAQISLECYLSCSKMLKCQQLLRHLS